MPWGPALDSIGLVAGTPCQLVCHTLGVKQGSLIAARRRVEAGCTGSDCVDPATDQSTISITNAIRA